MGNVKGESALLSPIQPAVQVKVIVDISCKNLRDFRILSAACNNHVSILLVVADILVKHRFDSCHVLRGNVVNLATALIDISLNASEQADVRFNMHVELEIHHGAQAGIIESMDSFHDDDIVRLKIFTGYIRTAVMRIIIAFFGNTLPLQQAVHIGKQQIVVENRRLVVVQQAAIFKAQVRMVFIVSILIDDEDAFVATMVASSSAKVDFPLPLAPQMPINNINSLYSFAIANLIVSFRVSAKIFDILSEHGVVIRHTSS